jgi:hypothetical protein
MQRTFHGLNSTDLRQLADHMDQEEDCNRFAFLAGRRGEPAVASRYAVQASAHRAEIERLVERRSR